MGLFFFFLSFFYHFLVRIGGMGRGCSQGRGCVVCGGFCFGWARGAEDAYTEWTGLLCVRACVSLRVCMGDWTGLGRGAYSLFHLDPLHYVHTHTHYITTHMHVTV